MKKVLIAIFLFIGIFSFAQEKASQSQMAVDKRLEHLKKHLNLDAKQEKQVKQVLVEQGTRIAALKAEQNGRKPNQKLTMQEKLALKSQVKKEQETMAAKLKPILTPEQFKKWEAAKEERMEKFKKEMKGLQ